MLNRSLESNKPCAAIIYVYKSKFVLWNGNGILLNQNFAKIDFFKKKNFICQQYPKQCYWICQVRNGIIALHRKKWGLWTAEFAWCLEYKLSLQSNQWAMYISLVLFILTFHFWRGNVFWSCSFCTRIVKTIYSKFPPKSSDIAKINTSKVLSVSYTFQITPTPPFCILNLQKNLDGVMW